jgi:hypothetical protein
MVSGPSFERANAVNQELSVGKVALICPRSQQQPFHTYTVSDKDWCAVKTLLDEMELGLELTGADGNCLFHVCVQFCCTSCSLPTHSHAEFRKKVTEELNSLNGQGFFDHWTFLWRWRARSTTTL